MWPCTSKKDDFIRTLFTKGHRPVRLPTSFGPGLLVGITRCCGHMPTGVLWVICVLFGHGVAIYRTCTLKIPLGSRASTLGTRPRPCGFHTGMGTSVRSVLQFRADAVQAWEYPYDQWCRALWGSVRPASTRSGYICQAKHDYVTFDPLGPGRLLTGLLWALNHW